jgi:hypothetical protein
MGLMTYECVNDPGVIDFYCVDLDTPQYTAWTIDEQNALWAIRNDALKQFNAEYVGYRLFFRTKEQQQKFLTWYELRWS